MNNVIVVTNLSYAVKINKPYVVNQSNDFRLYFFS